MKVFLSLELCMGPLSEGHQACGCFILLTKVCMADVTVGSSVHESRFQEYTYWNPLCVPSKKRTFSERSTNTYWLEQSPPPSPTSAQSSKLSSRDQSLNTYWEYRTHLFTYAVSFEPCSNREKEASPFYSLAWKWVPGCLLLHSY